MQFRDPARLQLELREDHWMNRQGDRLRQAIHRKIKFTLAVHGLQRESRLNQYDGG